MRFEHLAHVEAFSPLLLKSIKSSHLAQLQEIILVLQFSVPNMCLFPLVQLLIVWNTVVVMQPDLFVHLSYLTDMTPAVGILTKNEVNHIYIIISNHRMIVKFYKIKVTVLYQVTVNPIKKIYSTQYQDTEYFLRDFRK